MTHEKLATDLKFMFPKAIEDSLIFRNELTVRIKLEFIKDVCTYLKSEHGFNFCADICGADRFTEEERFEVIYNLTNLSTYLRLRLKVFVDEGASVPSVTGIWSGANWNERETYDMYGIVFEGHPDLRRMYMPEEFEYYPMRKDYPLIGVPGSIPLPEIDPKAQSKIAAERFNNGESV